MFKDDPNEINETETPLMAAAANGASEADLRLLVQVLQLILCLYKVDSNLQAGANPLVLDNFRRGTLLYNVAEQGHKHIIAAIIQMKVNLDQATATGATPLYIACCNGHDACAKTLMDAQADPNIQNRDGRTACFIAAQQGHAHVIAVLKLKADVKIAELKENTPLHAAALGGHTECVKELVSAGADILAVNGAGRTALQIAEESNNHDVAQLLRERVQHGVARTASGGV
jgi:ankyrin repeat protein